MTATRHTNKDLQALKSTGFRAFLATQFLGAFNDNLFKLLLICFAMSLLSQEQQKNYVPLATALFTLPYILFSSYAGYLADRFSKRLVMIATKAAEIAIMTCGYYFFRIHATTPLLLVLFAMGAQSAFFGPAKYGFLPEVLPAKALSRGNGAMQLFTFLAIILGGAAAGRLASMHLESTPAVIVQQGEHGGEAGAKTQLSPNADAMTSTALGGAAEDANVAVATAEATTAEATIADANAHATAAIPQHRSTVHVAAIYCVAIAIIGFLTSLFILPTPPGHRDAHFTWNPLSTHWQTLRAMRRDHLLILCLFGNAYFWFVGVLFQSNLPLLVKNDIGASDQTVGLLLAAVALGIGIGSSSAGFLSRGKIEYGLVLPGGLLMALFAIVLGICGRWLAPAVLCVSIMGFCSGFFQLPLVTAIQKRSPADRRGQFMGAVNAVDCLAMLLAAAFHWLLIKPLGLSASAVFVVLGLLTLWVLLLMINQAPSLLWRARRLQILP
jgi:acyl-[acyl-carrier-protein]-phospholipid O-acyltransferase/long-chain-fatty-acid--[acyl-carrier-protein] ligase